MAHIFDVGKYSKGMENAGADGRKDSSVGPGGIYHEKQIPNLCGLHAVNNLLQQKAFDRNEFDRCAQQLDQQERAMGMTFGMGEGNYRPDGFYNVTVLQRTLQSRGFQMDRVMSTDWKKDAIKHGQELGFIFNKDEHWFAYRRIHDEWFLLNSTQHRPVHFYSRELGSAVNFAVQDGYGVYSVRGNYPPCSLENNEAKLTEAVKGSGGSGPVIIKFGGGGHTLGGGAPASVGYAEAGAKISEGSAKELVIDDSKPKTKVQLQFPDGSKKAEEFNVDHTVGDLRAVCWQAVGQAVKVKGGFPPKDLDDDSQTLEAAGLKGARVTVALA
mmetsp:Transcript_107123/g.190330  ORF Transcript_107123/g.190330 Transcript_107123/m.190330 type:complete len:327 (+) Transcript_107123:66-1046(+)|eukprot:CAMPEP_0197665334 /NCGR_PEP_ID=MMETSP1338-20131121/59162_1 /TAXON_ID=43686 ORGANISM="Pelagodinium beii, Strain RCC1491" /NCGR_SAMPLE_ID=MMETSP1338 /ASSEMBLY_ACC=CAM_ASM_000754 /LENGTH=326 /DNA_ID=CAMNT_0043244115 /DNA_START=66 /DNA_END=1046 /DNA_ORIENTATION=-